MSRVKPSLTRGLEEVSPLARDRLLAFRLLILVSNGLRARMDRLLDPLTTQQAAVLTVIKATGAPSVSAVAEALATSHQNVKQIALSLERKGFLKIVQDPEDGRVRRLVSTPKNDKHWAQRDADDHRETQAWFAALDASEVRGLVKALSKLDSSLRADAASRR